MKISIVYSNDKETNEGLKGANQFWSVGIEVKGENAEKVFCDLVDAMKVEDIVWGGCPFVEEGESYGDWFTGYKDNFFGKKDFMDQFKTSLKEAKAKLSL